MLGVTAVDGCRSGRLGGGRHMRVRRWLLIVLGPAMLITLLACGAGAEETVTIDGETLTRREFEAIKKAIADTFDAFAEEDWGRIWNYLDAESKEECPRLEFVTSAASLIGLGKTFLGDAWWRETQKAARELADEMRRISWQEFRRDPDAVDRKLHQKWAEVWGDTEESDSSDWSDWHFEDGQMRLHWPDACERLKSLGD